MAEWTHTMKLALAPASPSTTVPLPVASCVLYSSASPHHHLLHARSPFVSSTLSFLIPHTVPAPRCHHSVSWETVATLSPSYFLFFTSHRLFLVLLALVYILHSFALLCVLSGSHRLFLVHCSSFSMNRFSSLQADDLQSPEHCPACGRYSG